MNGATGGLPASADARKREVYGWSEDEAVAAITPLGLLRAR